MSLSLRHRRRRPHRRDLAPGRYLTDGHRLLCVLGRFEIPGSMLVSVEDCVTLERHAYAEVDLDQLRLRRVWTPAKSPATAPAAPDPVGIGSIGPRSGAATAATA